MPSRWLLCHPLWPAPSLPLLHRSVYNVDHFVAELRRQGVQLMARSPDGAQPMQLELGGHYDALAALQRTYAGVQHIRCVWADWR